MNTTRQRIIEMHTEGRIVGRTLQDIGDEVGVSRQAVEQLLHKLGIEKPDVWQTPKMKARGQRQTEIAMQFWDAKAREHGFADFAALAQEWGTQQRLQVKEIALRLGVSAHVGLVLKRYGYTPEPYRNSALFASWKGKHQSIEQIEKRRQALIAMNQRKRELGLAMRGRNFLRSGDGTTLAIYIDAATKEKMWALAQRRGCSLSAVCREAMIEYLAKEAI